MQSHESLIQLALTAGAKKATIIRTEDIVVSSVFRDICASNSCGRYGRCWMCPPDNVTSRIIIIKNPNKKPMPLVTLFSVND